METDVDKILADLSIEEKAYLLSGLNFWQIRGIERFGLETITVADGPHGLRRHIDVEQDIGAEAIEAICFPTGSALAASFNEKLLVEMGEYLGDEAQAEDVQVLLGPANNIKRTPVCGRNFEYLSEDPYLAGKLATALIKGIQSKGVGTSLKHFVANNQERRRPTINAIIDERTLREIYLTAFEEPVLEGKPWTIMGAYNRLNGNYVCQNSYILKDILREQWGYEGVMLTDWGALDQAHEAIAAGLDLEMPGSGNVGPRKIIKAAKKGILPMDDLDRAARHIVEILIKANQLRKKDATYDKDLHHHKAREVAQDCLVLLKNDDDILPLSPDKYKSVGIIGDFAKNPRYQGGGSSHINSYKVDTVYDEFLELGTEYKVDYAQGYDRNQDEVDEQMQEEAINLAKNSDIVLLFIGLPDRYETEGVDRRHLDMPPNHLAMVEELSKVNQNLVVVLSVGSAVKLPFVDKVKGMVQSWLVGEAGAGAIVDILLGKVNPSGRLSESFIKNESDDPVTGNYPGIREVTYGEGIFIGYRYHNKHNTDLYYPFGYGLSYTSFEYTDLKINKNSISDKDSAEIVVTVKNTGKMAGKEVVQLYVSEREPLVERPIRELKGFSKVELQPGESKEVVFVLDKRAFAYYNNDIADWHVNTGIFDIQIAKSSRDIILSKTIEVRSTVDLMAKPSERKVYLKRVEMNLSNKVTRNTPIEAIKNQKLGKIIYSMILKELEKAAAASDQQDAMLDSENILDLVNDLPLRTFVNMTAGKAMGDRTLSLIIGMLNLTRSKKPSKYPIKE